MTLAADPRFWRLVKDRVVEVSQVTDQRTVLRGRCYVGKAVFDDIELEFAEKIPGAVSALINYASFEAFRVEKFDTRRTEIGQLLVLLIEQFLAEAGRYVSRGRDAEYKTRKMVGSLVGGRIDITESLHLRARGLRHQLAFRKNTLTHNTLENRLVFAAIREIGAVSLVLHIGTDLIERARELAMIFDDCRTVETLFGSRRSLSISAEIAASRGEQHRDLLGLAAVILSHESFELTAKLPNLSPRTWFLNLEDLFEKAVRTTFSKVLSHCAVHKGFAAHRHVFEKSYEADPDIVIRCGATYSAVGDAKYKDWEGKADQSDIYQLLAHASAFEAKKAFLTYPSDHFDQIPMGKSKTGIETWVFLVDCRNLLDDLQACVEIMQI